MPYHVGLASSTQYKSKHVQGHNHVKDKTMQVWSLVPLQRFPYSFGVHIWQDCHKTSELCVVVFKEVSGGAMTNQVGNIIYHKFYVYICVSSVINNRLQTTGRVCIAVSPRWEPSQFFGSFLITNIILINWKIVHSPSLTLGAGAGAGAGSPTLHLGWP